MELLVSKVIPNDFTNKYIWLDNDFLSIIYKDKDAFENLLTLCKKGTLMVDPLTRIEFLQSTNLPKLLLLKEAFLDSGVFAVVADHPSLFKDTRENALSLSYLYSINKTTGVDIIDLLIAGRVLIYASKALIITGNRKHYPSFIFDAVGVLNYEDGSQVRAFSVLQFNRSNYDTAYRGWERLKI